MSFGRIPDIAQHGATGTMSTADNELQYHLDELRIARDPSARGHILPPIPESSRAVLDVGCGAGQTLVASRVPHGALACGVDPDLAALEVGRTLDERVLFTAALGEHLPFRPATFDFVYARVALPYTHLPTALAEIERVLVPGGEIWLLLHPFGFALRDLVRAIREFSLRRVVYSLYVIANSLVLHAFGKELRWRLSARPRCESAQTVRGIRRLLRRRGFAEIQITRGRFFVVTSRKPAREAAPE